MTGHLFLVTVNLNYSDIESFKFYVFTHSQYSEFSVVLIMDMIGCHRKILLKLKIQLFLSES